MTQRQVGWLVRRCRNDVGVEVTCTRARIKLSHCRFCIARMREFIARAYA